MLGLGRMKALIHSDGPAKLSGGRKLRHELKFIIDEGTYRILQARLTPIMYRDKNSINGEYRVTSLYYDDIYNSGYNDKINGMAERRKFRIRSYNLDPSRIMLEAKHKDDNYVSKLSAQLTDDQYKALLKGDCSFMADHDWQEDVFGEYYRSNLISSLAPKLIVDYTREALVYPHGNVRITFDKKLSTCYNTIDMFAEEAHYSKVYNKEIILEVKFDQYLPASIHSVIQGLNAPRQSVSKFVICSDKLMEVKTHGF